MLSKSTLQLYGTWADGMPQFATSALEPFILFFLYSIFAIVLLFQYLRPRDKTETTLAP